MPYTTLAPAIYPQGEARCNMIPTLTRLRRQPTQVDGHAVALTTVPATPVVRPGGDVFAGWGEIRKPQPTKRVEISVFAAHPGQVGAKGNHPGGTSIG